MPAGVFAGVFAVAEHAGECGRTGCRHREHCNGRDGALHNAHRVSPPAKVDA
jgi:hypothetical protein